MTATSLPLVWIYRCYFFSIFQYIFYKKIIHYLFIAYIFCCIIFLILFSVTLHNSFIYNWLFFTSYMKQSIHKYMERKIDNENYLHTQSFLLKFPLKIFGKKTINTKNVLFFVYAWDHPYQLLFIIFSMLSDFIFLFHWLSRRSSCKIKSCIILRISNIHKHVHKEIT